MKVLSTQEVANRLDVARSTVVKWCQEGRFDEARKLGGERRGVWVIPAASLETFERPPMGRPPKEDSED